MSATRQMDLKEDDKSLIEALLESFGAAHRASDPDAMLDCYGRDPVYMPQGSPALIGRDAIHRHQEQTYKNLKFDEHYTTHDIEVSGDVAWVRGTTFGRLRILSSGKEFDFGGENNFPGANTLFILHREDGRWKIHRYMFNASSPVPVP